MFNKKRLTDFIFRWSLLCWVKRPIRVHQNFLILSTVVLNFNQTVERELTYVYTNDTLDMSKFHTICR